METKDSIRRRLLEQRMQLSDDEVLAASRRICEKLLRSGWYGECDRVLVYSAIKNEVDLTEFADRALSDGKEVYFPCVCGDEMEFYRVCSRSELHRGSFGVLEPEGTEPLPRMIPDKTPILVPGIAFSDDLHRIGYGKGYYDKYLISRQKNIRFVAIGIAYAFQRTPSFLTHEFDYPMEYLVTDSI